MSTVITITFNPCIDKSVEVPVLIPEKKLTCSTPKMEPGGGGINVARAIRKLGGSATAVYPAGGYHGNLLTSLLAGEGVPARPVPIEKETRENWIVAEKSTSRQFRFGLPGPGLTESEWDECLTQILLAGTASYLVVSGSLPGGFPPDIFKRIKALAAEKNARLVVDSSGIALQKALQEGVYLIKPSLNELASLIVALDLNSESTADAASEIVRRGYAEVVVISMGPGGALLVTSQQVKEIKPPVARKLSTVGAGDSMVAGILMGLTRNLSLENAVIYGVASGTAATMNPGTALCNLEDVETLYGSMQKQYLSVLL
jgi:6-phosphofructokinase 2